MVLVEVALHALALPLVHAARGIISAAVMLATAEQAVRQLSESVHDQVCLHLSVFFVDAVWYIRLSKFDPQNEVRDAL